MEVRGRRRYVHVRHPWSASIDASRPAAARFYARLMRERLHQPSLVSGPRRMVERIGRRVLSPRPVGRLIRVLPRRADVELDDLREALGRDWGRLDHAGAPPALDGDLALVALDRSAARTIFAFDGGPAPVAVAKLPGGRDELIRNEVDALREAEGAAIAPRYLGTVGGSYVQEAIGGSPLVCEPIPRGREADVPWPDELAELGEAFARLARATAKPGRPEELDLPLELALEYPDLDGGARAALEDAWRSLDGLDICVLRHGDTSPQNCLLGNDGRLVGIVDWEDAWSHALPGFDAWNAAIAYLERGLATTGFSEERLVRTFTAVQGQSRFWPAAAVAGREAARAAGVADEQLDALEVVFFGHRLIERCSEPELYPTTDWAAARMLEVVCASRTPSRTAS